MLKVIGRGSKSKIVLAKNRNNSMILLLIKKKLTTLSK